MTRDEALAHIKACRPRCSPNCGFLASLTAWADERSGKATDSAAKGGLGTRPSRTLSEDDRWMVRCNLDALETRAPGVLCSSKQTVAVLILPGSLSPPHAFHVKCLELARERLEMDGGSRVRWTLP